MFEVQVVKAQIKKTIAKLNSFHMPLKISLQIISLGLKKKKI